MRRLGYFGQAAPDINAFLPTDTSGLGPILEMPAETTPIFNPIYGVDIPQVPVEVSSSIPTIPITPLPNTANVPASVASSVANTVSSLLSPRPSPTVSSTPAASAASPLSYLTESTLVGGIPNMAVLLGGAALVLLLMSSGGGGRRR